MMRHGTNKMEVRLSFLSLQCFPGWQGRLIKSPHCWESYKKMMLYTAPIKMAVDMALTLLPPSVREYCVPPAAGLCVVFFVEVLEGTFIGSCDPPKYVPHHTLFSISRNFLLSKKITTLYCKVNANHGGSKPCDVV